MPFPANLATFVNPGGADFPAAPDPPQPPNGFGSQYPGFLSFNSAQAPAQASQRTTVRRILAVGFNPDWINAPTQWDTVTIQGVDLPGICDVTGKLGRKLDVNSPPGADGARLRDKGYVPCTFTINLTMWLAEQWAAWEQTNLSLIARRGRQRVALSVVHPALASMGVQLAYLQDISVPRKGKLRGSVEVDITMIEFTTITPRPPAPVVAALGNTTTAFDQSGTQQTQGGTPANPANNGPSRQAAGIATPPTP